jgi:hypothetical protein
LENKWLTPCPKKKRGENGHRRLGSGDSPKENPGGRVFIFGALSSFLFFDYNAHP